MSDPIAARSAAHRRYVAADGSRVPSVTTVLGLLAKPALITWANRLGLAGIDSSKYRDEAAAVGTLIHDAIERQLAGMGLDIRNATPAQMEQVEHALAAFGAWKISHGFEPVAIEVPLVSETGYGGTLDLVADFGTHLEVVDIKTSKDVYPEHIYQVSAYMELARMNGYAVSRARIVRVPRGPGESVSDLVLGTRQIEQGVEIFYHLLRVYDLTKGEE